MFQLWYCSDYDKLLTREWKYSIAYLDICPFSNNRENFPWLIETVRGYRTEAGGKHRWSDSQTILHFNLGFTDLCLPQGVGILGAFYMFTKRKEKKKIYEIEYVNKKWI